MKYLLSGNVAYYFAVAAEDNIATTSERSNIVSASMREAPRRGLSAGAVVGIVIGVLTAIHGGTVPSAILDPPFLRVKKCHVTRLSVVLCTRVLNKSKPNEGKEVLDCFFVFFFNVHDAPLIHRACWTCNTLDIAYISFRI